MTAQTSLTPPWLDEMNAEQLEAIQHQDGPLALLAVAGCGKTRALVHRIARMVAGGIAAKRILAVTFSKKAADEMNDRLDRLGVEGARVGTWHSLCLQILKEGRSPWADWEVGEGSEDMILSDALGYKFLDWKDADKGEVASYIRRCKANLAEPGSDHARALAGSGHQGEQLVRAYKVYQGIVEDRGVLLFDDFLLFTWRFLSIEENRAQWAGKWDYFLQDEAQDANRAQVVIAEMLAREHRNYLVVGDCNQGIYSFRGSDPEYLAAFQEEWGAKLVLMNRNYRCGAAIVRVANAIIRPGKYALDMVAERGIEGEVRVDANEDPEEEGEALANLVEERLQQGGAYQDVCPTCTNALSIKYEKDRVGSQGGGEGVRRANYGGSGEDVRVQSIDDRQATQKRGFTSGEKASGGTQSEVEGRPVYHEEWVRGFAGRASGVSVRTSGGDGEEVGKSTTRSRSGPSSQQEQGGQSPRQPGALSEQRGTHACPRCGTPFVPKIIAPGSYSDIVALFRTNAQSRGLEEALLKRRIPYVVAGGVSFYARKEVRDLLAYLRVAFGRDGDGKAARRCLNAPFRFLGKAFLEKVEDELDERTGPLEAVERAAKQAGIQARQVDSAREWGRMILELQRQNEAHDAPASMLLWLIQTTKYFQWINKDQGEETIESSHVANVRELLRVAERFDDAAALLDYIDETERAAARQRRQGNGGDRVLLMTIHKAKGLEWPVVFVAGCNEKRLPHVFGDLEEERRLMYVAATRAKDLLVLSYLRRFARADGTKPAEPSRFLVEAGLVGGAKEDPGTFLDSCTCRDSAEECGVHPRRS